ncbi:hypothetical protein [Nakamurella lactea]|uniref:hypothetical protein n=1 Tax=Nakamurella lactea TaxID=459515 RepID=UPI0003F9661D|nr:hypothetical protein [Nakamurella lactea]
MVNSNTERADDAAVSRTFSSASDAIPASNAADSGPAVLDERTPSDEALQGDDPVTGKRGPTWRHRLIVLGWTVPPLTMVLALTGFFPRLSPPALAWFLGAGNIECTANSGFDAFANWCSQVGEPLGSPLLSGLPETYIGAWLSYLPWVDAWQAYRLMSAICIVVGFAGAFSLLRRWGAPIWIGSLGAYVYLSSPTVLMLNGYTFTFTGYVLLPAALWLALKSFDMFAADRRWTAVTIAAMTSWVMVFTDGYSFIGGAVAIACLGIGWLLSAGPTRSQKLWGAGSWIVGLLSGTVAYLAYIPSGSSHPSVGIGAFRFYGLDLLTLVVPSPANWWSRDMPWKAILQKLWGVPDNQLGNYIGIVTAGLIVVAVVMGAMRRSTWRGRELLALSIAGLLALLLALGPALKVANFPSGTVVGSNMPADQAVLSLPTAWLYEHVPGFMDMRATYRTFTVTRLALVLIACVGLVMVWRSRRWRLLAPVLAVLLLVDSSSAISYQLRDRAAAHDHVEFIRDVFEPNLRTMIQPGERALILPSTNDFLATAIVPFTGGQSYNVGVDKNHELSRGEWPESVSDAIAAYGKPTFPDAACRLLNTDADVVVLTYVSLFKGGITTAEGPIVEPKLRARAQQIATDGRFEATETSTGIALRKGPGC